MQKDYVQRVAVSALIKNKRNEFLVVKRSGHDSHPNTWEMPGGAIDYGETPESGLKREVKEETGLSINIIRPVSTTSLFSERNPDMQIVRISFLCELTNEYQDLLLSAEHSAYKWVVSIQDIEDTNISDFLSQTITELSQ